MICLITVYLITTSSKTDNEFSMEKKFKKKCNEHRHFFRFKLAAILVPLKI